MRTRPIGDRGLVQVHVWVVVLVTVLTCGAALAVALSRPAEHRAGSEVEVNQTPTRGAPLVPDMGTEREVATSGTVASEAADRMSTSQEDAWRGLSVSVVTDTNVLTIEYTASTAEGAMRGAEAFTRAYTATRNDGQDTRVVTVITQPHALPGSSSRPLLLVLAAGLVAGVGLGVACAWLWDRFSDKVRSTGELERAGPPVLATDLDVQGPAGAAYGYLAGQLMAMSDPQSEPVRILVTSPRATGSARAVAARLTATLSGHGRSVELVHADAPDRTLGNGVALRRDAVVVQSSPSLLDDPETWVVAERADITLLAVEVGRLRRHDLDLVMRGLARAPGPVVGWVTCRHDLPHYSVPSSSAPPPQPTFTHVMPEAREESGQDRSP